MPAKAIPRSHQILDILRESNGIPVSTTMLIDLIEPEAKNRRRYVWNSLRSLRRRGLVTCTRETKDGRVALWSLAKE